VLKPEAARKLVQIADDLRATLVASGAAAQQASLTPSDSPKGL
jgi:hypothetical protein